MDLEITLAEPQADLATFAEAHRAWLVRRLALVLGDAEEAEDLAQQALLRATERWPLPAGSNTRAWLATVGLNLARDEHRRRRRWGFLEIRETDQQWAVHVDPDLWKALAQLDRKTRFALVLTVLDGYEQAEVAELLGDDGWHEGTETVEVSLEFKVTRLDAPTTLAVAGIEVR